MDDEQREKRRDLTAARSPWRVTAERQNGQARFSSEASRREQDKESTGEKDTEENG